MLPVARGALQTRSQPFQLLGPQVTAVLFRHRGVQEHKQPAVPAHPGRHFHRAAGQVLAHGSRQIVVAGQAINRNLQSGQAFAQPRIARGAGVVDQVAGGQYQVHRAQLLLRQVQHRVQ